MTYFDNEILEIEEIIEYLKENGINYFWHFTDKSNLESIRKYGIQSLWFINHSGIKVKHYGANELSHKIDYEKNLDLFVHLSFIKDHPMYWIAKKEGRIVDPVWLKIDLKVLYLTEAYFSDTIANKNGANIYSFNKIRILDFKDMFNDDFNIKKEARKAEILVKRIVKPYYIKGVYNGN